MNLMSDGPHAAADWLLRHVAPLETAAAELLIHRDGRLMLRPVRRLQRPAPFGWSVEGVYRRGLKYREAVSDLTHLRWKLIESPQRIREAEYWPSRGECMA